MAHRPRRRTTEITESIAAAIRCVFSAGNFYSCEFSLPTERGAQISMTGDVSASGNCGAFDTHALAQALATFPSQSRLNNEDLLLLAEKKEFTVLCGDCDRSLAMLAAIAEMQKCGINKFIISADTPAERDNVVQSLTLMRAGLNGATVSAYRADMGEKHDRYKAQATVFSYLTSTTPEIFVIGRDCFSRCNNIMRCSDSPMQNTPSLADSLSLAHAAVLCSAPTVDGARTLAKNSAVFAPIATVLFSGEVKNIRTAVIFKPSTISDSKKEADPSSFEQMAF